MPNGMDVLGTASADLAARRCHMVRILYVQRKTGPMGAGSVFNTGCVEAYDVKMTMASKPNAPAAMR